VHLLLVSTSFPTPDQPWLSTFVGEQVRLLSESGQIERITVVSPTTFVPRFLRGLSRAEIQASLPDRYTMVEGRCEVIFPRYLKAPGDIFLRWTTAQWCRIVNQTVVRFEKVSPISIIHANRGGVSSWAAIRAARNHNIPCVVTYQGSEVHLTLAQRRKEWRLCRDSFRWADLNLPVSKSLEEILRGHTQPQGRCARLLRGVDLTRFFPSPELCEDPHVLFVGRIESSKGVFDLLSAWEKVRNACPGAFLTMVGQDCSKGEFLRRARSRGVEASISLTGPICSSGVAEMMRKSRVLCLPSHGEGMPNCVMEALSCGVPVIATRVGGIPDIITHEENGMLLDVQDVLGLAAGLIRLLSDMGLCVRMSKSAASFAREHLDARRTVQNLIEMYHELIEANRKCEEVD
jgi:glycosyltransferase involved in cell wall biosynthesis